MPHIRLPWTEAGGQWLPDMRSCFNERYYNGTEPSPFVRLEDPRAVIWDLAFANRSPTTEEWRQVTRIVLWDWACWVELRESIVGFGWAPYPHRGEASVFADIHTLEQFSTEIMDDPEQVRLTVRAIIPTDPPAMPDHPQQPSHSTISISMIFGREYEPALKDLCTMVEAVCARPLVGRTGPPAGLGHDSQNTAAGHPGPEASSPPGETSHHAAGEPPAGATAERKVAESTRFGRPGDSLPAEKPVRPSMPTLEITVEAVPDTAEWLSFAAPTSQELLAPSETSDNGRGLEIPGFLHDHPRA
jgi:hypothetical protein